MNQPRLVRLALLGASTAEIIDAATRCGWLPAAPPDTLLAERPGATWQQRLLATPTDAAARWGDSDDPDVAITHVRGERTTLSRKTGSSAADIATLLDQVAALPFSVAAVATLYPEWRRLPEGPLGYRAPSLGSGLPAHGWLCAFRGAGHDRLVSRRWLEHGPWRLQRREGDDLSLVEFHDAGADAVTALAQARPGHRRMGIDAEGGYIQPAYVYSELPRGLRETAGGLLKVIVHGREVTQREMLDCCALRIEPRAVEPGPVSNVAYVFIEEDEARKHLHELWLRGLQCRAIREGQEVRLDTGHDPEPDRPPWVRAAT